MCDTYSHRFQHLSSAVKQKDISPLAFFPAVPRIPANLPDNGLASKIALGDHHLLGNEDTFERNLNTHILKIQYQHHTLERENTCI